VEPDFIYSTKDNKIEIKLNDKELKCICAAIIYSLNNNVLLRFEDAVRSANQIVESFDD